MSLPSTAPSFKTQAARALGLSLLIPLLIPLLIALGTAGVSARAATAGEGAGPASSSAPVGDAPSLATLKNTAYRGIDDAKQPIRLRDGRWAGPPVAPGSATAPRLELVNDYVARGDLDGDGRDEAVVVLAHSPGGSGTFFYAAVVSQRQGRAVNLATTFLGDRVQVRSVRVVDRRLLVDLVEAGPQDAACCPGQTAQRAWTLRGKTLRQARPAQAPGVLSVADIGSSEWALTHWRAEEPFAGDAPPTLALADGRLAGFSGCNRFFAAVTPGGSPGELQVSPPATTRRACAEAESAVETRFTQLLARVERFAFTPGGLVLMYRTEAGEFGALRLRQP